MRVPIPHSFPPSSTIIGGAATEKYKYRILDTVAGLTVHIRAIYHI